MKNFVKALAVSVALGASSMAGASVVSLPGNLTLDPLTGGDATEGEGNFRNSFSFVQWWETASGPTSLSNISAANFGDFSLQGYGELTPAFEPGMFDCNGCELTFDFSGIGLGFSQFAGSDVEQDLRDDYDNAGLAGFGVTFEQFVQGQVNAGNLFEVNGEVVFLGLDTSSAMLNIYLDYAPNLVVDAQNVMANKPAAVDGDLWLSLEFVDTVFNPDNINDGVFGLSFADTSFSLEATSGLALPSFENAQDISWADIGLEALSDVIGFGLTAKFNDDANGDYEVFSSIGDGSVRGNVVTAPSSIALFGLALVALGGMTRRRKA